MAGSQRVRISYSVTPNDHTSDGKENLLSLRHSTAYLYRTHAVKKN